MSYRAKTITQSVTGAAIFGALSFMLAALSAPYLPRMPGWGIAFIDPVSIIWIICFLIFGWYTGMLCSIIGTVGLMFFDPFTPIGPIMKLAATLPIILAYNYGLKLFRGVDYSGLSLKSLKIYIPLSIIGIIVRVIIMVAANILLFIYIFDVSYVTFNVGTVNLSMWNAVILVVILLNVEQSIWDCTIPYLAIYATKFYKRFMFW